MSFVDLSEYKSTKAPEREVELVDNHTGVRRRVLNVGKELDGLLVDFLRGRISIESIPVRGELDKETARRDLIDLDIKVGTF